MDIVIADNVEKLYGNNQGIKKVSLRIRKGEFIGVLGHSGAGKTTLMRLLCGAIFPTDGSLCVMGQEMSAITRPELLRLRLKIATVYQNFNVVPNLSVAHNVLMGKLGSKSLLSTLRSLLWLTPAETKRITKILTSLGLKEKFYERCQELSGGQQQRVAVARALFSEAEMIVADEPIASVDPGTAGLILNLFSALQQDGTTVIMNLHQVSDAVKYCTRLIALENGELAFDGIPEEFLNTQAYFRLIGNKTQELTGENPYE